MRKILIAILIAAGGLSGPAHASSAITDRYVRALSDYQLRDGPGDDEDVTRISVKRGETLDLMDSADGGKWIRVAKEEWGTGWIPAKYLRVETSLPADVQRISARLSLENRTRTRFAIEGGLSSGSLPFGKGFWFSPVINFTPDGVTGVKRDQVEVGALVGYHLGADVFGYIKGDSTKYQLNSTSPRSFASYGLFGQWLIRGGATGDFMVGPRLGFLVSQYNTGDLWHVPLLFGVAFRYFMDGNWGWSGSAHMSLESSVLFFYSLGFSYRF
jgi:hypothetical protein